LFNVRLQAEKSELRDEKTRLKAERERLEQMLKGVSAAAAPAPFVTHPAAAAPSFHPAAFAQAGNVPHPVAAAPSFHPAAFAQAGKFVAYPSSQAGKFVPYPSYVPPPAFWQWIPPTSLDTSKDPAHWPPVA
jgi:hypothetical protein